MLMMLPYMLAAIVPTVSTVAMFVARRGGATPEIAEPMPEVAEAAPLPLSFRTEPMDVRDLIVARVEALAERARAARVRVGFAVETGLVCVVAPAALQAAVSEAIASAIQAAPGGAVLVSAGRHGGRVRITIVDDGGMPDEAGVLARLRPATEALAMCGASVQVRARAGQGVTIELRVPDFAQTAYVQAAPVIVSQAVVDAAPIRERASACR